MNGQHTVYRILVPSFVELIENSSELMDQMGVLGPTRNWVGIARLFAPLTLKAGLQGGAIK